MSGAIHGGRTDGKACGFVESAVVTPDPPEPTDDSAEPLSAEELHRQHRQVVVSQELWDQMNADIQRLGRPPEGFVRVAKLLESENLALREQVASRIRYIRRESALVAAEQSLAAAEQRADHHYEMKMKHLRRSNDLREERDRLADEANKSWEALREQDGLVAKYEKALREIAESPCGIPGHTVAVNCGAQGSARAALAPVSEDRKESK